MRSIPSASLTLALALGPALAHGAPSGSAKGSTSSGVKASSEGVKWTPPERVVGGNAISVLAPFQIGIVSYLPKAKVAFEYDRQFRKAHWGYLAAGFLADRGNYQNFRLDECFRDPADPTPPGLCGNGSVLGFDVAAGYVHKFYVSKKPWAVPFIRAGLGFGWWKLPRPGGLSKRQQERTSSWTLNVQPGVGFRAFVTGDVGLGVEVQLPLGVAVHKDVPQGESKQTRASFLLGVAALAGLEYRF